MNWRGGLGWAVLAGLVVALAGVGGDAADEKEKLPADLACVPAETLLFVSLRPADVWNGELGKEVRKALGKDAALLTAELDKSLGVPLDQIERLTIAVVDNINNPLVTVVTAKPFAAGKVVPEQFKKASQEMYKGRTLSVLGERLAFCELGDRVYLMGNPKQVKEVLDGPPKKGDLTPALALASGKHGATLGVNLVAAIKELPGGLPEELDPWKPLFQARVGMATLDVGEQSSLKARLTFANADAARAAEKAARDLRGLGLKFLPEATKELGKQKEMAAAVELLKLAGKALEETKLELTGSELRSESKAGTDAAKIGPLVIAALQRTRESAARIQSANNLKQIGVAMHSYLDSTGSFPAHAVFDKDGKPLLSWRVLLLPYVEQDALYKEFKLNEPWDSPHNKKLLEKMPKLYADPLMKADKPYTTFYQGFVGAGAFFEGKKGIGIRDITDGTSNTLMIVQAGSAVPWTKPEDLPFKPGAQLPKLGGTANGFNALFADGSVRFFSKSTSEKTLRAVITRNGGEVIDE
jgi:prepilin-type processing-associated H-X9-DG protein